MIFVKKEELVQIFCPQYEVCFVKSTIMELSSQHPALVANIVGKSLILTGSFIFIHSSALDH